ncbi:MAG: TolC family protein [Dissulfurispiraceae bacterium]
MNQNVVRAVVLSLFLPVFLLPAYGQEEQPKGGQKMVLTLEQCVKKAVEVSPEIGETRYETEVYKSKQLQADSAVYPRIEVLALGSVSPEAKSDQLFVTDYTLKLNGIFGNATATVIQPIYTFGKIDSYREAASSGVKVAQAGVSKKTSDIVLRTKELYYSLLLAKDLRNLVLEIQDDLLQSVDKAEKQIKEGSPWADELNLFKLRAFLGEVEKNLHETEKGIAIAKDALMTSMGLPKGSDFEIADATLSPEERIPDAYSVSLTNAMELRPELIQLREGINARQALVEAEKSEYYPKVFLAAGGSLAGATNRERVNNPYINDFYDHAYGFAFIGVSWSYDFGITKGKVREAVAEHDKLIEKKRFADEAIPLQIRKAYLDLDEATKNIEETQKGYTNARKWLVSAIANFDMGVGEAKDIGDAAVVYAKLKADNLRYKYNQRLSYANLMSATGLDLREIK